MFFLVVAIMKNRFFHMMYKKARGFLLFIKEKRNVAGFFVCGSIALARDGIGLFELHNHLVGQADVVGFHG